MECLTFSTEANVLTTMKQLGANYIKLRASQDIDAIEGGYTLKEVNALSIDELLKLNILGRSLATGQLVTTAKTKCPYATIVKAYDLDIWYFKKPPQELMEGVVDYTEAEKDKFWDKPEDQEADTWNTLK